VIVMITCNTIMTMTVLPVDLPKGWNMLASNP
jgi:hypothetical protein